MLVKYYTFYVEVVEYVSVLFYIKKVKYNFLLSS